MIPDEITYCIDSIPRWQRLWLKKHRNINRSGFIQKCLSLLIQSQDPEYYESYKEYAERIIRRQETTPMPDTLFTVPTDLKSTKINLGKTSTVYESPPPTKEKIMTEFMKKVQKTETCWLWMGTIRSEGYGTFNLYNYGAKNAHRTSYELFKGEIPPKMDIDHLCRNKQCVNPEHLEAVTRQENIQRAKSYPHKAKGEKMAENYIMPDWEKVDEEYKNLKKSS